MKLVHIVIALALTSCGGRQLGSAGEGGDSGSQEDSGQGSGSSSVDASRDGSSSTDASPQDSEPPDTGGAACVLSTYMCQAQGLSAPCWYCPPSFFSNCGHLGLPPNHYCRNKGGQTCFTCGSAPGPQMGILLECEGDPLQWTEKGTLTCSD
jgi:hypothetical protein